MTQVSTFTNGGGNRDSYRIGCNIFELLFDISFKRHGALIVIDAIANMKGYVASGILKSSKKPEESLLPAYNLASTKNSIGEKRKALELSSIDGALLFNEEGVFVGYGAMIKPHANCPDAYGARTRAALSTAMNGGVSFKVSSDGEITVYFRTPSKTGDDVHQISFL